MAKKTDVEKILETQKELTSAITREVSRLQAQLKQVKRERDEAFEVLKEIEKLKKNEDLYDKIQKAFRKWKGPLVY